MVRKRRFASCTQWVDYSKGVQGVGVLGVNVHSLGDHGNRCSPQKGRVFPHSFDNRIISRNRDVTNDRVETLDAR